MTSKETMAVAEIELLEGDPINDYNGRQMQLAVEKFVPMDERVGLDEAKRNEIMISWIRSGLSAKWREFVEHANFKDHPRFHGNYADVTLKDLEEFITIGKLPE